MAGRPGRKVAQYDIETGELIEVYDSIFLAAEDNFITDCTLRYILDKSNGISRNKGLKFGYA